MATKAVTFRVEEAVLEKARLRAGGGAQLADVMRKTLAAYGEGKWKPAEAAEHVAFARAYLKQALEELGEE